MPALSEMITAHFGVTPAALVHALQTLPAIHPQVAALSQADSALFDASDFGDDDDAYSRVITESLGHTARLLSTAYTAREVAELLGVNDSRVRQRRADRTLWAIQDRDGWVFPAAQFDVANGRPGQFRGLDQVFASLPAGLHPLSVAGFLTTPQDDLRIRGQAVAVLDWLRSGGEVAAVLEIAEAADWASR
jgi:hypothetical protein